VRQAGLIFRLQRYQIETPRLLAFGQRHFPPWRTESFLLTEWPAGAVRLTDWLTAPDRHGNKQPRRDVLRQAGALLRRIHDAGCQVFAQSARDTGLQCPLAVRTGADGTPIVALGAVEWIAGRRQRSSWVERRDLTLLLGQLAALPCTRTDRLRLLLGYLGARRLCVQKRRLGRIVLRRKGVGEPRGVSPRIGELTPLGSPSVPARGAGA